MMIRFRFLFTLTVLVILNSHPAVAQETVFEEYFTSEPGETVHLNLRFGEIITVRGREGDDVIFRATVEINGGRLNDAFVLDKRESDVGIYIGSDLNESILRSGRESDCPKDLPEGYSQSYRSDYFVCHRIVYELIVPTNIELKLETISADVEIRDFYGPVDVRAISGFVDLSWPASQGADLTLSTVSGEAYSDLEALSFLNRKNGIPEVGYMLKGELLSGGIPVRLETISGDIFLRTAR